MVQDELVGDEAVPGLGAWDRWTAIAITERAGSACNSRERPRRKARTSETVSPDWTQILRLIARRPPRPNSRAWGERATAALARTRLKLSQTIAAATAAFRDSAAPTLGMVTEKLTTPRTSSEIPRPSLPITITAAGSAGRPLTSRPQGAADHGAASPVSAAPSGVTIARTRQTSPCWRGSPSGVEVGASRGEEHAVDPEPVGDPNDRPDVPRVLDSVEG